MSFNEKYQKKVVSKKIVLAIIVSVLICIVSLYAFAITNSRKTVYASENISNNTLIADELNANIDVMNILEENTQNVQNEEYFSEEIDLEYLTTYEEDSSLPKGMVQVIQEGRDGIQIVTTKKIYEGDKFIKEEEASRKIVKASINKVVLVGTGKYKSNYKVKVGDTLYATPDTLGIYVSPNKEAEKIMTLNRDDKVSLLEINGEWYKIQYQYYTGYAPANCFTYLKPESELSMDIGDETVYSKEQLISKLNFNMNLNEPSGLTLEQFKKVLSGNSQDKNKIFENNAEYFYYAEKQYNVNGIFIAAVGIHESGWGTSQICLNKRNLFGYGAYDRSPYNSAYSYSDYSESIDLIARVFAKYYLNPSGTQIYDGNIASGAYYNGATLTGVNTKYATDKNWANAVYSYMKTLYNNL